MVIAECFWLEKLEISFILSIDERGTYFYLIGQSHKKSHAINRGFIKYRRSENSPSTMHNSPAIFQ